jgi:hypothetical protein
MTDLVKRLRAEIFALMGPNGATYSEEPVVFYEEAAVALVAKDAEIVRLRGIINDLIDAAENDRRRAQHKGETP